LTSMGMPYRSPGRTKAITVMMRAMVSGLSARSRSNHSWTTPTSAETTEAR